jgi:(2Fe-2S) ferredoxin
MVNNANIEAKKDLVADGQPVTKPPQTVEVGKVGNLFQQDPVIINAIVTLIVLAGTVWGTDLDPNQVAIIVGSVFTIGSFVARQMVTPMPKAEAGIESAYRANPVRDAKPVL